jgi:hypothetical protein
MVTNKIHYNKNAYKLYKRGHFNSTVKIKSDLNDMVPYTMKELYYQVLNLLPGSANMLEIGSNWSYYFNPMLVRNHPNKDDTYITIENPSNIVLFNGYIDTGVGVGNYVDNSYFECWNFTNINTEDNNIKKIIKLHDNIFIDILYSDMKGAEGDMILGTADVLNKIGFFVIFTYRNSHQKCMDFIADKNFKILIDNAVDDKISCSGLIIAMNNEHINKYENIDVYIQKYFQENCHITKH